MLNNTNYLVCDWIGDGSDLDDLDRATLKAKFRQFQDRLPIAVAELKKIIEPAGIELNYSVESLSLLQDWLIHGVAQFGIEHGWPQRSENVGFSRYPNKINRMTVLSPYWKSLISDSAVYFGEVFQEKCPGLHWEMMLKSSIEKGYPFLTGWPHGVKGTGFSISIPYLILLNIARGEKDSDTFFTNAYRNYMDFI